MSASNPRHWLDQQLRLLGNWEPKMFLQRRGDGSFLDVDELWRSIHSDAALERMRQLRVNLCHIHFHKGYGLEHEAASIAEAKAWAQKLHAQGIRVGAYIGSTFFFEAFRHPHYERMVMKNGHSGWSGSQYFRKFWCYNSPEAIRYFEQVVRVGIQEVQADVLHFDSGFCYYLDKLCHCEYCLAGFHKFVRDEIPEIVRAAGYESADQLLPPPLGNLEHLTTLGAVREPGLIAWMLYQAEAGYRALKHLADYGRSLRPDVGVLYNGANLCGITPFSRPHREMDSLALVDMTAVEDSLENPPGVTADGMPVSRFRAYKAAARTKTRALTYTVENGRNGELMLAEAALYSYGGLGCIETAMQTNHRLTREADLAMYNYLVDHESLFLDREPWHNAAVLRHHESMLLNPFPCALTPYAVEQVLFEDHVPFAIVSATGMTADSLSEFELVVLPDVKCLSDREAGELARYVERGGRLLSIGNTGTATPLNQYRAAWSLGLIFGQTGLPASDDSRYEEIAQSAWEGTRPASAKWLEATFGQGRAIHLPGLQFRMPDNRKDLTRFAGFDWYYHPYWCPSQDAEYLLKAVSRLLGEKNRIETDLPRQVGAEYYRVPEGYRIHVLNYRHPIPAESSRMCVRAAGLDPKTALVRWQTPSEDRELSVTIANEGGLEWQIPAFDLLGTLTVSHRK